MNLFSLPMLSRISSTIPLVFMSTASVSDSLAGIMQNMATMKVPRIFVAHAVNITRQRSPHTAPLWIVVTSVFNLLEAKYNSSNKPKTKSSILSINLLTKLPFFGTVNPNSKAPNIEWIPIRSVTKSYTSTPANVKQT